VPLTEESAFEAAQFVEPAFGPGEEFPGTIETRLGYYTEQNDAVAAGRAVWESFRVENTRDVAWWTVRVPGETMARWIADSRSPIERVLNLTLNQLVEVDGRTD